ncbi:MAG: LysR family transcriptional regulator [Verrucomicrobiales bacterium]|nr:LysR family transcriptional regulator [Verrucomicrobiales bacterium]
MLNIHHLELFYYVAKHGGIAQAVRNMPYGIQQPAISAQIIALEDQLGVTLFRRRPFELTQSGKEVLAFVEPFFSGLDDLEARIRGVVSERLRVGASQTVLKEHLPAVLRALREKHPRLKLVLRAGYQQELERMLTAGEIDVAVTVIDRTIASGLKARTLIELPMALYVPKGSRIRSADEFLASDRIEEPLISLRPDEALPRLFQQELAKRGLAWPISIEAGTLELVTTYAAEGFGVGLGVEIPGTKGPAHVKVLALGDYPRLTIGLIWVEKLSPVALALGDQLDAAARALTTGA